MTERQASGIPEEFKRAEDAARKLAKTLGRPVSVDRNLGITIGNVTFGWEHVRDSATPLDLADLVDYFEEIGVEGEHFGIVSKSSADPEWQGWLDQSSGPIDKPAELLITIDPPRNIRKLARKAFLGK